jgi:hypothetical protein
LVQVCAWYPEGKISAFRVCPAGNALPYADPPPREWGGHVLFAADDLDGVAPETSRQRADYRITIAGSEQAQTWEQSWALIT